MATVQTLDSAMLTELEAVLERRAGAPLQRVHGEMEPSLAGSPYVNFLSAEGEERVKATYGPEQFARLRALKGYDPSNLFRLNQNIPPSTGGD